LNLFWRREGGKGRYGESKEKTSWRFWTADGAAGLKGGRLSAVPFVSGPVHIRRKGEKMGTNSRTEGENAPVAQTLSGGSRGEKKKTGAEISGLGGSIRIRERILDQPVAKQEKNQSAQIPKNNTITRPR